MSTTTAPDLNVDTALDGTVMGAGRPKIRAVVTIISASAATPQTVSLTKGEKYDLKVFNEDTEGYVIVDAAHIIPLD